MNLKRFGILGAVAVALTAGAAMGQTWDESGDAPDLLPGQETQGSGPLTTINGTTVGVGDVDLYKIVIDDEAAFTVSSCGVGFDTQLFLFDADGNGVTHRDDECGLQSTLSTAFVNSNGVYYVAVTSYNNDPEGPNGLIWNNTPFAEERAPDGPGAPGPLQFWTPQFGTEGSYSLALTGATFGNAGGGYSLSVTMPQGCPGPITVSWTGAGTGQQGLVLGNNQGAFTIPQNLPCGGTVIGVTGQVQLVDPPGIHSTQGGAGSISGNAGTAACGKWLQLVKGGSCATSNTAQIQ